MSEKAYSVYIKQIDQYFAEYDAVQFANRSLSLCSSGLLDPHLTPSEYMQICKHRANLVVGYGREEKRKN